MALHYTRMATLKTSESFRAYTAKLGIYLPFDEEVLSGSDSPLAQPYDLPDGRKIGNRFCVQPMEGWDGSLDGKPSELTYRRWRNFGRSGAKLVWGGEATAVRADGRANPNQLMMTADTMREIEKLRLALVEEHRSHYGAEKDLLIGLQLTHSGRFCRPNDKMRLEPKILYHHPVLDQLFNIPLEYPVMTDGEIEELIGDYIKAARCAQAVGFDFVDIKHCHGYLGHEFLSAYSRPGAFGGSFENRTRFLREITAGIRNSCPGLLVGIRLSAFDFPPFRPGADGVGKMMVYQDEQGRYPYAFGGDPQAPGQVNMDEVFELLKLLEQLEIPLVNLSAGSPYYNPHTIRPALFPPCDGYQPPEDPLVGVARHINIASELKAHFPQVGMVGSAYTYLQEWLPNVAQHTVRTGMIDFVGLGRMMLSYPELPADILAGRPLARKLICRTFSDCTTAPRRGLASGCYRLDKYYTQLPEAEQLLQMK